MKPARDPASAIVAQLAPLIGPALDVEISETPWASATFTGRRLGILLSVAPSSAIDQLADAIGTIEFELRGWFVADIIVTEANPVGAQIRLWIDALVIEEA